MNIIPQKMEWNWIDDRQDMQIQNLHIFSLVTLLSIQAECMNFQFSWKMILQLVEAKWSIFDG